MSEEGKKRRPGQPTRTVRRTGPRATVHNISRNHKKVGNDGIDPEHAYGEDGWPEVSALCRAYGCAKETVWHRWHSAGKRKHGELLCPPASRELLFCGKTHKEWAELASDRYNLKISGRQFGQSVSRYRRMKTPEGEPVYETDEDILNRISQLYYEKSVSLGQWRGVQKK